MWKADLPQKIWTESYKKILVAGGATLCEETDPGLTHVVVSDKAAMLTAPTKYKAKQALEPRHIKKLILEGPKEPLTSSDRLVVHARSQSLARQAGAVYGPFGSYY